MQAYVSQFLSSNSLVTMAAALAIVFFGSIALLMRTRSEQKDRLQTTTDWPENPSAK